MKKEEEMLLKEKNYQSMQEELDDIRRLNKALKNKY